MNLDNYKQLSQSVDKVRQIKDKIEGLALKRAEHEGLLSHPRLSDPTDHFYNDKKAFALFKCAFYECFKCKEPYFGGLNDCENDAMRAADTRK